MPSSPTATARDPRSAMSLIAALGAGPEVRGGVPRLAAVARHQQQPARRHGAVAGTVERDRREGGRAHPGRDDLGPGLARVARDRDVTVVTGHREAGRAERPGVVDGPRGARREGHGRPGRERRGRAGGSAPEQDGSGDRRGREAGAAEVLRQMAASSWRWGLRRRGRRRRRAAGGRAEPRRPASASGSAWAWGPSATRASATRAAAPGKSLRTATTASARRSALRHCAAAGGVLGLAQLGARASRP